MAGSEAATGPEAPALRGASVISRFRLAGAAVILGVGLVGVVFYALVNSHFLGTLLSQTLGPYTDTLAEHGLSDPDPDIWRRMAARHHVQILIEPAAGPAVAFDAEGQPLSPTSPALGERPIRSTRTGEDGTRVTFYWHLLSFRDSHLPLLGGLVLMVAAVVGTALGFLHRHLKPLTELHRGVDAVTRGDFATRVPVVRDDEIGRVAGAFNVMAGRVGEMIDDRERLLADVSHELRSPITRMKVALELLPESDKRDALARDLSEMENLIAVLLEREALRSRAGRLENEDVDLAALAGEVAAVFADRGPGVELISDIAATIRGDRTMLKLLIHNLVDNATKFSRPDSRAVMVSLETADGRVNLRIADDGVGIPPGSEERLFEPFVKLDRARGHGAGYGLGLDLCQRIVRLHGGTLQLAPRQPRGTEAVVNFSITPETDPRSTVHTVASPSTRPRQTPQSR